MPRNPLKTCLVLLLCLTYLLVGAGGARAFICTKADGSSHAAVNPAGSCVDPCQEQGEDAPVPTGPEAAQLGHAADDDCRDVQVGQAAAKNLRPDDPDRLPSAEPVTLVRHLPPPSCGLIPSHPGGALRLPPPSPMLAALRTIVLLN